MPYRSELKRPDLKGNFPCSVCGKIFCHSSSLSRHRMQAHFKSYQCMQCNQEISSNETLRTHMIKTHQIARMFMCRCCNWAFPDKTSLHLHTTSLSKTGKPGEVAVLARSFAEGDDSFQSDMHNTPSSSPPERRDSISPEQKPQLDPPTMGPTVPQFPLPNPAINNMYMGALLNHLDIMRRNQEKNVQQEKSQQEDLLSFRKNNGWLDNNHNPFMNVSREQQALIFSTLYKEMQNRKRTMTPDNEPRVKKECSESPSLVDQSNNNNESLNSTTTSTEPTTERKNKRKSRKPQQLPQTNLNLANLNIFASQILQKQQQDDKKNNENDMEQNQLSPAVSDSHTSGSGNEIQYQDQSDSIKNGEDKPIDYAEKFANIGKMVGRFIELIQEDRITEEKETVIDLAFKIREQCSDV